MADVGAGTVQVHLFAAARAAVGQPMVETEPGTLGEILGRLEEQFPPFRQVRARCSYLVDEVAARDEGMQVPGGGRIDVLPPFAGG